MKKIVFVVMGGLAWASLVGCAAQTDATGASSDGEEGAVGQRQLVTSVNSTGTWTADAVPPNGIAVNNFAEADFTGPAGYTRKMGVCLLRKYNGNTPCTGIPQGTETKQQAVDRECGSSPATLPTGGVRYCTAADDVGQKYCHFRPGDQANYCAGSPALGGTPVSPGTYLTPHKSTGIGTYISYACFEGCAATDPSSSSASVIAK